MEQVIGVALGAFDGIWKLIHAGIFRVGCFPQYSFYMHVGLITVSSESRWCVTTGMSAIQEMANERVRLKLTHAVADGFMSLAIIWMLGNFDETVLQDADEEKDEDEEGGKCDEKRDEKRDGESDEESGT